MKKVLIIVAIAAMIAGWFIGRISGVHHVIRNAEIFNNGRTDIAYLAIDGEVHEYNTLFN